MRTPRHTSTELLLVLLAWWALMGTTGRAGAAAAQGPQAETGAATNDGVSAERVVLDAVRTAWEARDVALRECELRWAVTRDSSLPAWSAAVAASGALISLNADSEGLAPPRIEGVTPSESDAIRERHAALGRLRVNATLVRFDGECVPCLESSSFAAAFQGRFAKPESVGVLQPYTAILDRERGRHVWQARGDRGALAFTARRGESLHAERASLFVRPVRLLLVDAALWGLRPLSLPGRPVQLPACALLMERPRCGNQECLAVEERIQTGTRLETRTYWIDPSRDHVIVRMLYSVDGLPRSQLDIQYDRPAGATAWVPWQWSGLQFDQYQQAGEVATAIRTDFLRQSIPVSVFQAEIPAGSKRVFPDWKPTPHRTLHLEEGPDIEQRWRLEDRSPVITRSLLRFAAWPWIMITLVSGWAALTILYRVLRSRQGKTSSVSWTVLRRQVLGIVLAALVAFLLRDAAVFYPSLSEIRQELDDTWTLGRELRQRDPTQVEWNTYSDQAEQRIQTLLHELEVAERRLPVDQATSRHQWKAVEARTLLMRVATELLPATLSDRRPLAVSLETQLVQCLDGAGQLLDNDSLAEAEQPHNAAPGGSSEGNDAWIMAGILVGNAAFLVGVLILWLSRRPRAVAAEQ